MKSKRSNKLIRRSFQLRMIAKFVGVAALAMVLQFLLLGMLLTNAVQQVEGSTDLFEQIPRVVLQTLAFSMLVLLPVLFGMGILLTHRIAGPIYRFEAYLKTLSRSEHTGPCKTRDGDELDSLRDVINEVAAHVDALERRAAPSEPGQAA